MENDKFYNGELPKQMHNLPAWADASGKNAEIVVSSKIRLARNLRQFKFPLRATQIESLQVFDFISQRLEYPIFALSQLSPVDRERLVERHIVKREFLIDIEGKGVSVWDNESFNIVINDEEHLKIQHIVSGLNLEFAYKEIDEIDDKLSEILPYAFSPQFGYLTASPTNTGTALRGSAYLHLPGLVHSERLRKVLDKLNQLGFFVRPFSGEGTRIEGNFFEIANQTTLGRKEEELINGLDKTVLEIIEHEKEARDILFKNARLQVQDKIWRAYAILKNAQLLSWEEFLNLSSAVRLGIGGGIFKDVNLRTLNELLICVQPAHLKKNTGRDLSQNDIDNPTEMDSIRAKYVREILSKNNA